MRRSRAWASRSAHAQQIRLTCEGEVRARQRIAKDAVAMKIGLDRTTVPMAKAWDERCMHEKIETHCRRACVGTVAPIATDAAVLQSWCYAAPAYEGPRMATEALRPRRRWLQAIDFYRAPQHVHHALAISEEDTRVRRRLLRSCKKHLLTCGTGIERIRRYFHISALHPDRETGWTPEQQRAVDKEISGIFFADLLGYATLKARGHHVGSGVTKGVCKSLIMLRAKRSGQRWPPKGIHAVLTLRTLVLNDRGAPFWNKVRKDQHALESIAA